MKTYFEEKELASGNAQKQQLERTVNVGAEGSAKRRGFKSLTSLVLLFVFISFAGCNWFGSDDDKKTPIEPADAGKPTKVESFTPDSGGIATPMIVRGENFGTDTANLEVLFISERFDDAGNGTGQFDTVPGAIVSTNGKKIYLMVPKLTYKKDLKLLVRTKDSKGKVREVAAQNDFRYITETTVTTVAGRYFEHSESAVTKAGTLGTCSFSGPMFICVDANKNVLIVERLFNKAGLDKDMLDENLQPRQAASKKKMNGCFLQLNEEENRVDFMIESKVVNAPTINPTGTIVYVPTDGGADYYVLNADENYSPRLKSLRPTGAVNNIIKSNWKFSFVTRKSDGNILTVMYKSQILMINPRTNQITVLCNKYNFGEGPEGGGTDIYLMFDPRDEKILYACSAGSHTIFKIKMTKKDILDDDGNKTGEKDTVDIKPWAGGMADGLSAGASKGWADAGLKQARFCYPRQITFDKDAVMYIADSGNQCIRTIDTKLSDNVATVKTLIGIPKDPGNADGGPELAKFRFPMGIAVAEDGTIYIADTRNHLIRKLAVQ